MPVDPPTASWKSGKTAWWKWKGGKRKKRKKEKSDGIVKSCKAERLGKKYIPKSEEEIWKEGLFSLARGKEIIIIMIIRIISGTNREERCGKCGAGGR